MNKKCVALTQEKYEESIALLRKGFILDGKSVKPNDRIATIEVIQVCLGLRLGDVLQLTLADFIKDGERWRLNIREQKTNKERVFTVPLEIYNFIQSYAYERGIGRNARLFPISSRQVERHLNRLFQYMELPVSIYGSHSYRKFFATKVYIDSGYNIELVRVLLQHSSVTVTQRYIGIQQKDIEDALQRHICLV